MQTMLPGLGTGGRRRTPVSGTPLPLGGGLLDLGLVGVPLGDQADDQVARIEVRDVLHRVGDVDDIVALDHAQAIVIEIAELHFFSPSSNTFLATLAADMAVGQPE